MSIPPSLLVNRQSVGFDFIDHLSIKANWIFKEASLSQKSWNFHVSAIFNNMACFGLVTIKFAIANFKRCFCSHLQTSRRQTFKQAGSKRK